MNDFFSIIGSIASLISIPLAVFLFYKTKEAKLEKLKKNIIKILSNQIGSQRQLSAFEINTVVRSKLRESNIKVDSINISDIIEDFVLEIITNPLIDEERKLSMIENLKNIHSKGENSKSEIISLDNKKSDLENISELVLDLEDKLKYGIEMNKKNATHYKKKMSTIFATTIFMLLSFFILFFIIILRIGFVNFNIKDDILFNTFKDNEFLITLAAGAIVSVFTILTTPIVQKIKNTKKNNSSNQLKNT